jgi:hypothetical protein
MENFDSKHEFVEVNPVETASWIGALSLQWMNPLLSLGEIC